MNLSKFQDLIGYHFQKPDLLIKALTHRSYISLSEQKIESKEHNERLEFLGDAVLELVVTEYLFQKLPDDEGHLTALRAALVNSKSLLEVGLGIGLADLILLSDGEKAELGRARDSIVTDAVEAVIGAIYLDSKQNLKVCSDFINKFITPKLSQILAEQTYKDPKTKLQEYTQKEFHKTPRYRVLETRGKDHAKVFVCGVFLGSELLAKGEGASKQKAETKAAKMALNNYSDQAE